LKILKIFSVSAAARLYLFLISGGCIFLGKIGGGGGGGSADRLTPLRRIHKIEKA
jgi:hypothetical protein